MSSEQIVQDSQLLVTTGQLPLIRTQSRKIFISGLLTGTDHYSILKVFSTYGEVVEIVIDDKYATVEFKDGNVVDDLEKIGCLSLEIGEVSLSRVLKEHYESIVKSDMFPRPGCTMPSDVQIKTFNQNDALLLPSVHSHSGVMYHPIAYQYMFPPPPLGHYYDPYLHSSPIPSPVHSIPVTPVVMSNVIVDSRSCVQNYEIDSQTRFSFDTRPLVEDPSPLQKPLLSNVKPNRGSLYLGTSSPIFLWSSTCFYPCCHST